MGLFITFEGPDGSGKSTHIRLLTQALKDRGCDVVVTREPGGCPISEKIRELVLDKENSTMDPVTEALLYAASRAQHVREVIKPALAAGKTVISDRYVDSSIAYQGIGRGLGEELVRSINAPAIDGLMPDITFFLSVGVRETQSRISDRDLDRLELAGANFHQRVYQAFGEMAQREPARMVTINATRPKPEVHRSVMDVVERVLQIYNK